MTFSCLSSPASRSPFRLTAGARASLSWDCATACSLEIDQQYLTFLKMVPVLESCRSRDTKIASPNGLGLSAGRTQPQPAKKVSGGCCGPARRGLHLILPSQIISLLVCSFSETVSRTSCGPLTCALFSLRLPPHCTLSARLLAGSLVRSLFNLFISIG